MKIISLIIVFIPFCLFAETKKELNSKIESVTVYQRGAQIKRRSYYNINAGIYQFVIKGISGAIDPKSLQVNGTGKIIILDSKYQKKYPKPEEDKIPIKDVKIERELKKLNDSLFDLEFVLTDIQNKIDVLHQEKSMLIRNGTMKGIGKVNDSIPILKEALIFFNQRMNEINKLVLIQKKKLSLQNKVKNRIQKRINSIHQFNSTKNHSHKTQNSPIHQIVITVRATEATSGKIKMSYLVGNSGWTPLYDIRSNSSSNSVTLTYKAHVFQNTGIDWNYAKLILSTNNPYSNKTKPTLSPFYINYNSRVNRIYQGKKYYAPQRSRTINTADSNTDIEEDYAIENSDESKIEIAEQAHSYTKIIEQLIDVEYSIDLPYSITSNNEKHMVLVREEIIESNYKYYSIPKLDLSTFLITEITNFDQLNLLAGNANIFHDGTYLGETKIQTTTMDDTIAFSLGKEKNIQIKRTLLKKDSKTKIIGDKTIKTYAYLIEVKNHKNSSIDLTINDQIPITQNQDIIIEVVDMSKGSLDKLSGKINWNMKLKPKENKKVKLIYTITHSKTKSINLTSI